jgi:hypothetical protein
VRKPSTIPLTIAVSAFVHVVLFGAAQLLPEPPHIKTETPVSIELVPRPPEPTKIDDSTPVDVVFLDPESVPAAAAAPTSISSKPAPERGRALGDEVAITVPGSSTTEMPSTGDSPARNPYLDMRRAPRPGTFVRNRWDDLENVPKGTAPEKDISTGQLAPDGGGTHKSDQGPFTAKIDKDGSVKLTDNRNFNIRLTVPTAKDIGDMFQAWYYDPNKPVGTLPPPNMPARQPNLTREDISGAERLSGDDSPVYAHEKDPNPGSGGGGIPIAAGGFDITDAFMRGKGIDPYASKKLAFLDSTRDERVQIGTKYKSQQLAQVAQIVKKNLARVWAATNDPQQRKQALFEMWDECVETGSAEVVEAALIARRMIVGFMRANFPPNSEHAFTVAEIAACNQAKQSSATFAPYE